MKTIKRIIQFLKGKNVYLQDFQNRVREMTKEDGKTYFNVKIEISEHLPNQYTDKTTSSVEYSCYIDGYSHCKGESIDNSVNALKKLIDSRKNIPQEEIENIII